MKGDSFEYTIIDDLLDKLILKISIFIAFIVFIISIILFLNPYYFFSGIMLLMLALFLLVGGCGRRIFRNIYKVFIMNNEKIQVIYPKVIYEKFFLRYYRRAIEDIVFEIQWNQFEKIILRKKTLKNSKFERRKTYRILKFIGKDMQRKFILNRFHETKQIEITLLLENYCKKKGKEYLEK